MTREITALNKAAWDASAQDHTTGDYWDKLTAGFAEKSFSCLDATLTDALRGAGVRGTRIVQIGCNKGREVL